LEELLFNLLAKNLDLTRKGIYIIFQRTKLFIVILPVNFRNLADFRHFAPHFVDPDKEISYENCVLKQFYVPALASQNFIIKKLLQILSNFNLFQQLQL